MGGRETTRGIFLQALVCILEALQNDNLWKSLALEPKSEAEKVDIVWGYSDGEKVVQVKSSQNQVNVPEAKRWAEELASSYDAKDYTLILIGPCSGDLSKGQIYEGVVVPSPKPLDIQCLLGQTAHHLAIYLEHQGKPAGEALTRENVVFSLIGKLQEDSIQGKPLTRDDFESLLDRWVQDAFNKEQKPSREQLETLREKIQAQSEIWVCVRELNFDNPDAKSWRDAIQRYMRELDRLLPGDNFEKRRADIPWHKPDMSPTTEEYKRGCDQTQGLLKDAQRKLQEEIDSR